MSTSLDPWSWVTLGSGLLFLGCYAVLLRREWRKETTATARWVLGLSSAGLVALTLGGTFPIERRFAETLVLAGALLCLIAFVVKWRTPAAGGSDEHAA